MIEIMLAQQHRGLAAGVGMQIVANGLFQQRGIARLDRAREQSLCLGTIRVFIGLATLLRQIGDHLLRVDFHAAIDVGVLRVRLVEIVFRLAPLFAADDAIEDIDGVAKLFFLDRVLGLLQQAAGIAVDRQNGTLFVGLAIDRLPAAIDSDASAGLRGGEFANSASNPRGQHTHNNP